MVGVADLIGTAGRPEPVPDAEVEAIQRLARTTLQYDPHPFLTEGMDIEVASSSAPFHPNLLKARSGSGRHGRLMMTAIDFVQSGELGHGWRLEARKAGVVIGVITENEGQYFFYKGADIKVASYAVLRDTDLEKLKAAVQKLF